jgi:hypothetical protein
MYAYMVIGKFLPEFNQPPSDEEFFSFFKQEQSLVASVLISLQIFGRLWLRITRDFC